MGIAAEYDRVSYELGPLPARMPYREPFYGPDDRDPVAWSRSVYLDDEELARRHAARSVPGIVRNALFLPHRVMSPRWREAQLGVLEDLGAITPGERARISAATRVDEVVDILEELERRALIVPA